MGAKEIKKTITTLFDIRVETMAANLLSRENEDENFDLDNIIVAPLGSDKRRIGKDIESIKKKYFDHDTALLLGVNRKGLFDTLPDRLFLRLDEEYENAKKRTKAIKQQRAEARKFFLPYEQAMYHPRIEAELLEQKYTESFPQFIHDIWGLPDFDDCLDDRQRFLLCYLLPEAYGIVGKWNLTGLIFESVLQKPVNLRFIAPVEFEIPNSNTSAHELKLGENTIMGSSFRDDTPALEVIIMGITHSDIDDYLPGGKKRRILEELLCGYFIPLDVHVIIQIKVTEDTLGFSLGEDYLGYNVMLN